MEIICSFCRFSVNLRFGYNHVFKLDYWRTLKRRKKREQEYQANKRKNMDSNLLSDSDYETDESGAFMKTHQSVLDATEFLFGMNNLNL